MGVCGKYVGVGVGIMVGAEFICIPRAVPITATQTKVRMSRIAFFGACFIPFNHLTGLIIIYVIHEELLACLLTQQPPNTP